MLFAYRLGKVIDRMSNRDENMYDAILELVSAIFTHVLCKCLPTRFHYTQCDKTPIPFTAYLCQINCFYKHCVFALQCWNY